VAERPRGGHRTLPHTADVRIEAWAPTREQCAAEAVAGLVAGFAHVSGDVPTEVVEYAVEPGANEDMLAAVLDEVIYRLDTTGQVPVDAQVSAGDSELRVLLRVTDLDNVDIVGATPKAVSLHELRFAPETGGGWSCGVTLDV
jgi:SHS2 domain-containing protein